VRDFSIAIFAVNVVLYAVVIARGHFPFDALGMAVLPDFIAHLTGGTLALHRDLAHLYDIDAQSNVQQAITHDPRFLDLYISPPLASLLYAPFARLPYALAAAAWTCVTLALLFLSARTIRTLTPSLPRSHRDVMLVAAMASQPVIQLLGSGQDTAISLLLWSSGVALALERRDAAAGLVMSLGLFKPQLFVLPPLMFLALRRKRAIGAWVTGALAQAALTLVVFGPSALQGWWRILQSPEYRVFLRVDRAMRMTSIMPFIDSVLPHGIGVVQAAGWLLGAALSLAVVVATLWRSLPGETREALDERGAWALACFATLLASPHLFYYDMTLLALPVALLVEIRTTLGAREKGALVAIYLLTWTAAVRAGLESAAWPLRVVAASWTAIPLFYLWRVVPTRKSAPGALPWGALDTPLRSRLDSAPLDADTPH
jgi:hypothetical protein